MRVLYLSRGLGVHDRRFISALSGPEPTGRGWTVEAVPVAESQRSGLVPGTPAFDRAVDRLTEVASSFGPDVTVAGPLLDVGFAAVQAGIRPLLGISWAFDLLSEARQPGMSAVARKVLAGCDIVACDAQAVADAAIGYGVAPDAIARFAWGVDLARFQPGGSRTLRAQLGWDQAFIVLSTRAHEPMYAMAVLIEAFRQAVARRSEMRMLVLGAGSQRTDLEASVAAAGLEFVRPFRGTRRSGKPPRLLLCRRLLRELQSC